MMEARVVSKNISLTDPLAGVLDPHADPAIPSTTSIPKSSPPPTSALPVARPCRPKPPPPPAGKSCQPTSFPPLPLSSPPVLSPPLLPPSTSPQPVVSSLPPNPPPPSLLPPPPQSPTLISLSPLHSAQSSVSPSFTHLPPATPISQTSPSPLVIPSNPSPLLLSPNDRLVGSALVWQPKGLSLDQITSILENQKAGTFLVHSKEGQGMTLSVCLPDENGTPGVQNLMVKQYQTFVHLNGSHLIFDDIFKLISFYSASRDILAIPLRLPQAITMVTKREELEVISAMGADFWTSDLNLNAQSQEPSTELYLYINPVSVEESSNQHQSQSSISKSIIGNQNVTSSEQNGEVPQKASPCVKGQTTEKPNQKYKRPPPRPPSLSSGSGMGLLFSSPPSLCTSSPVPPAAERKEEGKGGVVEKEEQKSKSTSPPPLRPPVPPQSRGAPPLPPAPVRHIPSRNSTDQNMGERGKTEKGKDCVKNNARGEVKVGSEQLLSETVKQENSSQNQEEVNKNKDRKEGTENLGKEGKMCQDKGNSIQCQSSVKKPFRPVPPPRRHPCPLDAPLCPNQTGGGSANKTAGVRVTPQSAAQRPDVSLYSPQGGAVVATDPDSCSTSSSEEEGELNQDQEQNSNHPAKSYSTKVKRTSTTVMLGRARTRISTVLTGLMSHDCRLTKRIVELARDPLSYFGNLVKEHRAFTLETMSNHSSSTELLQEIRQMVTQLKSYLLQSTELQGMLEPQHLYTQDKLESIVEVALCKSVLKPLREPIYQSLEKLHSSTGSLKQLAQNQSVVLGSTTTALGVTTAVPEASAMEKISIKLSNLHLEYSPQKKIELLLKACKIIYESMSVSSPGRVHGADDFLPVMMYVLARSNLSNLLLDVEYMMELMDPSLALGEGSYYLTTTYGALEHIKTFDQQRSATRQLSREVQDSIHRWERRRTLNQEYMAQGSVRDFLTVYCPEVGANPKTLGVLPTTTIQQLAEQCTARFEQDSYMLSVYVDGVRQPLASTELAVSVKNNCKSAAFCFVYHPPEQLNNQPSRSCPTDPPPAPPVECFFPAADAPVDAVEPVEEEGSLITL